MTSRDEREQIRAGIAALEAQRSVLGAAVADAAIAGLRARLEALDAGSATDALPHGDAAQALRQVTIVFLDVVGSTTLSQRLDPEDVHAVMDGALQRLTVIVGAHGGRVLQYAGDNLLAVFGADGAREDDAERAVRCGLALLAEGRVLGAEVRARHGHAGFDVRVGAHTGGVLLGGGVDAEGSIRGIAVNVAARMEQTAPPGAMRISRDTHAQVRGAFDLDPQPPIAVKGLDAPVASWLVLAARPRRWRTSARGIEGVATRLVGRDAELARLQRAWVRLHAQPRFALVTVIADAGVGKTRLLHEFEDWTETRPEHARAIRARAYPSTQDRPYGLLHDVVARSMRIGDNDRIETARHKLEAGVVPLFEGEIGADLAQAHAHVLGHLIGIDFGDSPHVRGIRDDARQIRNRAFHVAAQMLRRLAHGAVGGAAPLVLQIEDLHWADDGTLDFLELLQQQARDVPLLLLALARPQLQERRPGWGTGADAQRIDLAPLDASASRTLADELLQRVADIPPALRTLIVERAEGNPFYMEELVRMLIDLGAIVAGDAGWTVHAERLDTAQIPTTLTGVLQARLDGLPRAERVALQEASVIGHVFWDRALAALDPRAPDALPALVRRALTRPRDDARVEGVREFAFGHQILHRVTYGTVLRSTRRKLHARAAAWLVTRIDEWGHNFLGAVAEHYAQAGDVPRAAEYHARSAEYAKSRHALGTALDHAARGLALLVGADAGVVPDAAALRWRLLFVRDFVLNMQGRRAEQRDNLVALRQAADALGDPARRALALRRQSLYAMRIADFRAQAAAAREAMAIARESGDDENWLESQRLLADALAAQGDLAAGEALARDGLAEARARGLRRVEATYLNALSFIATRCDDQVSGLAYDLQDLAIWPELGDRHGEALALGNVGASWLWFGALDEARRALEESLRLLRAVGAHSMVIAPLGNLAQVWLNLGDATAALALAQEAAAVAAEVQATDFEIEVGLRLGEAELALGRHADAARTFERAEAQAREIGHGALHDATAGRARAALEGGDVGAALRLVEPLLAQRAAGGEIDAADVRFVLWSVYLALDAARDARAGDWLAAAYDALERRASTISDAALRTSFIRNLRDHRAIADAWAAREARAGGTAGGA